MTKPQQPEIRRSGRGATDQDSTKAHVDEVSERPHGGRPHGSDKGGRGGRGGGPGGGVPPEQQPPHPA